MPAVGLESRWQATGGGEAAADSLSGTVMIDGSSTVLPISQACAEEFQKVYKNVKVVVGTSDTGGGFKKLALGETDINDASRPIKSKESDACKQKGIEFIGLVVAIDGLSVMGNPANDFVDVLTTEQLKKIWSRVRSSAIVDSMPAVKRTSRIHDSTQKARMSALIVVRRFDSFAERMRRLHEKFTHVV